MVIVGASVRFELRYPDLSENLGDTQTPGTPLPGIHSSARVFCPMDTERGTLAVRMVGRILANCFRVAGDPEVGLTARSTEDLWRIFNAAPLRMQVLNRALTT